MFRKGLVAGIIFLFIAIGFQPAFAVEISNDATSDNIEDCGCDVVDDYDIVRVKSLLNRAERSLNRVEIFSKIIPILHKDNPELIEDCEELSEKITTFKEMNEELKTYSTFQYPYIICNYLEKAIESIAIILAILNQIMETSVIMHLLLLPIFYTIYILGISHIFLSIILKCDTGPQ
jgi:hypothetical protein